MPTPTLNGTGPSDQRPLGIDGGDGALMPTTESTPGLQCDVLTNPPLSEILETGTYIPALGYVK